FPTEVRITVDAGGAVADLSRGNNVATVRTSQSTGRRRSVQPPSSAATEYTPDANTIALFHMNETKGLGIDDSSTNGLDAVANGTLIVSGRFGRGRRLRNDVTAEASEWISMGAAKALNPTNGMTFEAWIHPMSSAVGLDSEMPIVTREDSVTGDVAYALGISGSCGGVANALYFYNGAIGLCSSDAVALNEWSHVAFTLSQNAGQTTARLYINGELNGERIVRDAIPSKNLVTYIGRHWGRQSGARYNRGFDGMIDEVRFSDRARLAREFAAAPP
ncbi:MAG TPA: LamG domain-containing protein, partial [Thermoanaerobaculia bacterium]